MPLPSALQDWIDAWRTQIRSVNCTNARTLHANSVNFAANISQIIKPDPKISLYLEAAVRESQLLAAVAQSPTEKADAQRALVAIDAAEAALGRARSNDTANNLGFGWQTKENGL